MHCPSHSAFADAHVCIMCVSRKRTPDNCQWRWRRLAREVLLHCVLRCLRSQPGCTENRKGRQKPAKHEYACRINQTAAGASESAQLEKRKIRGLARNCLDLSRNEHSGFGSMVAKWLTQSQTSQHLPRTSATSLDPPLANNHRYWAGPLGTQLSHTSPGSFPRPTAHFVRVQPDQNSSHKCL